MKGKVIVCIVGDPPSEDPKFFGGKALTYYGRWTYKFEQAARMGAAGYREAAARYSWSRVAAVYLDAYDFAFRRQRRRADRIYPSA